MERIYATVQPILDIVDEGLRLYRMRFVSFVLLTALWVIPIAVGLGISIATESFWGALLALLLSLPLALYLIGGLSRVTLATQEGRSMSIREALSLPLLRMAGMGCYSLVFSIVANIISSMVSYACFCPGFIGLSFAMGASTGALENGGGVGEAVAVVMGIVLMFLFVLFYVFSLILSGATYSSLVYSLQPFVQHDLPFGMAVSQSVDLITYRFGYNLLAFLITSTIFGASMLTVTTAIGVLLPLPLVLALGEESPVAQGIGVFAWIAGLMVVLPPLPIWMALLYQRNNAAREGRDLTARIATLIQEEVFP